LLTINTITTNSV